MPNLSNRVFDEEFNKMMRTVEAKTIVLDSLILLSKTSPEIDSQYHINDNGFQKIWEMDGEVHRHDGPAVIHRGGTQEWFWKGSRHRLDGPAIEYIGGRQEWYRDGKRHRLDGPALIDGKQFMWFVDGHAPACVETIWEGQVVFVIQPEWTKPFDLDHLPSAKHIAGWDNWCKIYILDEVDASLLKLSMKVTCLL